MQDVNWDEEVVKKHYITGDIIALVMEVASDPATVAQCRANAKALNLRPDRTSMRRLWEWVRENVDYREDDTADAFGPNQDVPYPARALAQGYCDCKGMAILVSGHLQAAGISHEIRFTRHLKDATDVHHVFVAAQLSSSDWLPIDCTIPTFGVEALPIYQRITYPMSLRKISGPDGVINDGLLALQLYKERLELEKSIAVKAGINGVQEEYAYALADVDAAMSMIERGDYDAIGAIKIKVPPIVKNAANAVKNGVEAAAKAVTAVQRKLAEEVIAVSLPAAAPFFVYLFAPKPELLSTAARTQRQKAEKIASFITDTIGMKESRFMEIVRNGIMKKLGKTPEAIIAAAASGGINGIGIVDDLVKVGSEVVSGLIKLISTLAEKFNKKKPDVSLSEADAPTGAEAKGSKAKELIETFAGKDASKPAADGGGSGADGGSDTASKDAATTDTKKLPGWVIPVGLGVLGLGLLIYFGTRKPKRRRISGVRRKKRKTTTTKRRRRTGTKRPARRRLSGTTAVVGATKRKRKRRTTKRKAAAPKRRRTAKKVGATKKRTPRRTKAKTGKKRTTTARRSTTKKRKA